MDASGRENQPPTKRRKVRKGTHSCWECKKRKERCIFLNHDVKCVSCQKRSTACVSQEFADDTPSRTPPSQPNGDLQRVESLLQQVLDRLDAGGPKASREAREDRSTDREEKLQAFLRTELNSASTNTTSTAEAVPDVQNDFGGPRCINHLSKTLSHTLHAALPSRKDAEIICRATIRHQMGDIWDCAYDDYESDCHELVRELLNYPPPDAPPVVLARHLLRFATLLQQRFRPGIHEEIKELSEPIDTLIDNYANAAAQFLTHDRLLGSSESIECLVLRGIYECASGNMRLSWMLTRRAIAVAQMSGYHLHESRRLQPPLDPDPRRPSPRKWWVRLNFYDRLSSLLLALPMSVDDGSITDAIVPNEPPLTTLERLHCVVLGDIVRRNQADIPLRNYETTKTLDRKLQKIAEILPASWWTMPLLTSERSPSSGFREAMRRITLQLIHSHLILQVHLPYLLQPSAESEYEPSRLACVGAAREILTRFITCRLLSHDDMVCRISDFIAFTAAVTLALAYLSRHHQCHSSSIWPAHYRHSDLGTIQQVERIMREGGPFANDSQCAYMADMLHQLLRMESKAADGCTIGIRHVKFERTPADHHQDEGTVSLQVPYFGTLTITEVVPHAQDASAKPAMSLQPWENVRYAGAMPLHASPDSVSMAPVKALDDVNSTSFMNTQVPPGAGQPMLPHASMVSFDAMPSMFAGVDDWALQGVDTTLFSSLFGQTGGDWVLNG